MQRGKLLQILLKQHTMNTKDIIIKETETTDFNDIMEVEKQAFGYDKEAELVAGLLKDQTATPYLSLLAFYKMRQSGIFFSQKLPWKVQFNNHYCIF